MTNDIDARIDELVAELQDMKSTPANLLRLYELGILTRDEARAVMGLGPWKPESTPRTFKRAKELEESYDALIPESEKP